MYKIDKICDLCDDDHVREHVKEFSRWLRRNIVSSTLDSVTKNCFQVVIAGCNLFAIESLTTRDFTTTTSSPFSVETMFAVQELNFAHYNLPYRICVYDDKLSVVAITKDNLRQFNDNSSSETDHAFVTIDGVKARLCKDVDKISTLYAPNFDVSNDDAECLICLGEISAERRPVTLKPCDHKFCLNCVVTYFNLRYRENHSVSCPKCRRELPFMEFN